MNYYFHKLIKTLLIALKMRSARLLAFFSTTKSHYILTFPSITKKEQDVKLIVVMHVYYSTNTARIVLGSEMDVEHASEVKCLVTLLSL